MSMTKEEILSYIEQLSSDITEEEIEEFEANEQYLFGRSNFEIFDKCYGEPFPGTDKFEPNHPIWDCHCYKKKSPKEAWSDPDLLDKAIDNLFWICHKGIEENKDNKLLERVENAFNEGGIKLQREVLLRFTIARIAPKVTALMPSVFDRILEESKIDISNGIYCPMAGFGGIIEGARRYYKKHNINAEIEAYDINPTFCKYFGWTQRDVLSQKIETDKVVFVCPPFGLKTELWKDTPIDRDDEYKTNYLEFKDWVKEIKEHVEAPNYIFVGPEIGRKRTEQNSNIQCSLFGKKYGIQWYPEYSVK